MVLTAEYRFQTIDALFVEQQMPKGIMTHRNRRIDPLAIRTCGMLTVEGENDDISGIGQTREALELCSNLSDDRKANHLQKDVGHYGVFNGFRFRRDIVPRMADCQSEIAGRT